ncbi:aldehyde dehydrogenase (NADP(+)) [Rhodovulum sp. DZ06]|uniref:aldehyde dehydrogenase (NADP(+)) n=1 Tax=Rhodovulum sp. DZ06 TaxID=3425126 RepID=UPI003D33629F
MSWTPKGAHLVAGDWVAEGARFASAPVHGPAHTFHAGTPALADRAMQAAEAAFETYGRSDATLRAAFLNAIAEQIEARAAAITEIGCQETGLPEARLQGERGRTTGQLRLFAEHILKGDYLDQRHDAALPDRAPLPRPELKMIQRPIGPVAVFGASNFPLAFSTAGGDTASALAAGCPVVVKGHPAHPGTGEIVAEAIAAAARACGIDPGVFSLIQDDGIAVGVALAEHPLTAAVGFTGSLRGGRALFDICARRPSPIPFFGELGSVNPMFLLPAALGADAAGLGQGWAASLTMGVGQFCTNPGVAVALAGADADAFAASAAAALGESSPAPMLTEGIAEAYRSGRAALSGAPNVEALLDAPCTAREGAPALLKVCAADFIADPALAHEVFGPVGLLVIAQDMEEVEALARSLSGQLTATLHMTDADMAEAARLLPILERKAGRILANGFPTGVEVADAMVHGGPYPASTNFGATSVGTLAIRRWLRPVCFQNMPAGLSPF